jgi:hypothetical protein
MATATLGIDEVVDAILAGQLDEELGTIREVCTDRMQQRASGLRYKLRAGDRVRVVTHGVIRPHYLDGLTAVVRKVNKTTVTIDFEDQQTAGRFARGCRCPIMHVEKIEDES